VGEIEHLEIDCQTECPLLDSQLPLIQATIKVLIFTPFKKFKKVPKGSPPLDLDLIQELMRSALALLDYMNLSTKCNLCLLEKKNEMKKYQYNRHCAFYEVVLSITSFIQDEGKGNYNEDGQAA